MLQNITLREKLFHLHEDAAQVDAASPIIPAVSQILRDHYIAYSPAEILSARFAITQLRRWKGGGSPSFDLIWRIPGQEFTECLLCVSDDEATPGGWLVGDSPAVILDETINEFAVIVTRFRNRNLRHTFDRSTGGYMPDFGRMPAPLASALRLARQRSRPEPSDLESGASS